MCQCLTGRYLDNTDITAALSTPPSPLLITIIAVTKCGQILISSRWYFFTHSLPFYYLLLVCSLWFLQASLGHQTYEFPETLFHKKIERRIWSLAVQLGENCSSLGATGTPANPTFEHCAWTDDLFRSSAMSLECPGCLWPARRAHQSWSATVPQIGDGLELSDSLPKVSVAHLPCLCPGSPEHIYGSLLFLFFLWSLC